MNEEEIRDFAMRWLDESLVHVYAAGSGSITRTRFKTCACRAGLSEKQYSELLAKGRELASPGGADSGFPRWME